MSLSEQMASTPSPPVSRLIQAAAAVLRAAGWTVTPPAYEPPADLVPTPEGNWRLQWRARRETGQQP